MASSENGFTSKFRKRADSPEDYSSPELFTPYSPKKRSKCQQSAAKNNSIYSPAANILTLSSKAKLDKERPAYGEIKVSSFN
jgi:hypothetical protein